MFGFGTAELLLFVLVAYYVFVWKTFGPPRWK